MANDMQNEIRERYNSLVEMNAIKGSLRSLEGVNIPGLTSEQFEILLNRIAGPPPPPPPIPTALGNPGPLGLAAFALTTFMLSVFNAGSNLIDPKLESVVLPVALFYGGIAQFAAGMWEFRINNTFGATAFTSYGAFWMSFAAYVYLIVPTLISTGNVKQANGLFLFSWLIFTLYMTVAAYRTSRVLFTLFVVLSITFLLLVIGNLSGNGIIVNVGGSEMS
jgi:succinate-acetate transporter protein